MINQERLLSTFYDLLRINSPSGREKGVACYCLKRFQDLGIASFIDNTSIKTNADTGNVIAVIDGGVKGLSILFNAHLDTIQPTENLVIIDEDGKIETDGKTILGADNKTGLAVIIEMVETLKDNKIEHIPIEVAFTVSEEIGLLGANALDLASFKSKSGYCFDGGGAAGQMILKSPTQEVMKIDFKGKAVHAGVEPEKGINAIFAAAKAASNFPQGRLDEETTANLGQIYGGTATNVVAEEAGYKLEIRSHNKAKLQETVRLIEEQAKKAAGQIKAKVSVRKETSFTGFKMEETEPVVKIAAKALDSMGIEPVFATSGGGSDANVFNAKGIRTLTLGMGSKMAHSNEESVEKDELVKVAQWAVEIVKEATNQLANQLVISNE